MPEDYKHNKLTPSDILHNTFGYRSFREHQEEIIKEVMAGRDAFVLMPTGMGKSICYQIPAMLREGVGIVVSPLIALMQDQVHALRINGIHAEFLNSSLTFEEGQEVKRHILSGEPDLLYVAPERLLTDSFQDFLRRIPISLFAIDEAHCVSQWGHDFRPEYLRIPEVTRQFPDTPRLALTATADAQTRRDIVQRLGLQDAAAFVSSFDRPNIRYRVTLKQRERSQLLAFIRREHPDQSGIVYVRTRKRADQTAAWLQENGVAAQSYHAGQEQEVRLRNQERFLKEDPIVMVATIAFGMGIDKPDVRFVAHLDLPASMEAYYQETGRAGRDGEPADAWMVYSLADLVSMRRLFDASQGDETFKQIQRQKLEALLGYCETVECRRTVLLRYFGEHRDIGCDNCDTCLHKQETWDGTTAARMALSCVYRTGQRFGVTHLTDLLNGNATEKIKNLRHDKIKTFGVGAELSKKQWSSVYRQLLATGLLSVGESAFSGFRLTSDSWPVLKGEQEVHFRQDPAGEDIAKKRKKKSAKIAMEDLTGEQLQIFEKLRALRLEISNSINLPPYCVFHDKTLKEMAVQPPETIDDLLEISGIGQTKAAQYGDQFLKALASLK